MNKQSRRGFFKHSASLAGVMSISPFLFRSSRADASDSDMVNQFEILSSSTAPFNSVKVIDTDNVTLTLARLNLIRAVRVGLARALDLLGVSAPESM